MIAMHAGKSFHLSAHAHHNDRRALRDIYRKFGHEILSPPRTFSVWKQRRNKSYLIKNCEGIYMRCFISVFIVY